MVVLELEDRGGQVTCKVAKRDSAKARYLALAELQQCYSRDVVLATMDGK